MMRPLTAASLMLMSAVAATGCNDDESAPAPWAACQASDQAFVDRAMLAANGRRPWGHSEVALYADVLRQVRGLVGTEQAAREVVLRTMMADPGYLDHWTSAMLDFLEAPRAFTVRNSAWDLVNARQCYKPGGTTNSPALASWIRDHGPLETDPPVPPFSLGDLLRSTLILDDLSPVYRANLFHLVSLALAGANVDLSTLERARRADFGQAFESEYINRNTTCLGCHNARYSVTHNDDPSLNHFWPVPGQFEQAVYGNFAPKDDPIRFWSVLRFVDVVVVQPQQWSDVGGRAPWGWDTSKCGKFNIPTEPDPLQVDAMFASVRSTPENPEVGSRASVWALEGSLARGFDNLAAKGLELRSDGSVPDPDVAFAYLVSMNIVEKLWEEVTGHALTIAHNYPRTAAQRDTLAALTERFISSRYSLQSVLVDIVNHPLFNQQAPDAGCGGSPYDIEPLFDPFSIDQPVPQERGNSAADIIQSQPVRVLRSALHSAMEWPPFPTFPSSSDEEDFQLAVGFFNTRTNRGFRGLDFQGRLSWEAAYGACAAPGGAPDYITKLLAQAAEAHAPVQDVVIALKDRLIDEPFVEQSEADAYEALLGRKLADTNLDGVEPALRMICGALVVSPQFALQGIPPVDTSARPALIPSDKTYKALCKAIAGNFATVADHMELDCSTDPVTVTGR